MLSQSWEWHLTPLFGYCVSIIPMKAVGWVIAQWLIINSFFWLLWHFVKIIFVMIYLLTYYFFLLRNFVSVGSLIFMHQALPDVIKVCSQVIMVITEDGLFLLWSEATCSSLNPLRCLVLHKNSFLCHWLLNDKFFLFRLRLLVCVKWWLFLI